MESHNDGTRPRDTLSYRPSTHPLAAISATTCNDIKCLHEKTPKKAMNKNENGNENRMQTRDENEQAKQSKTSKRKVEKQQK